MKIRMAQERTGPRHDGRMWPPVGAELEVEDEEGAALVEHGIAYPVAAEPKAETRPAPEGDADKRAEAAKAGLDKAAADAAEARADAKADAEAAAPSKPPAATKPQTGKAN